MPIAELHQNEKLFRLVIRNPNFWEKEGSNRPSSAVFKDSKGVSVDRKAGRSDDQCVDFLINRIPNHRAIVSITVHNCEQKEIFIEADPVEGANNQPANPYHMLLKKNKTTPSLTRSQARHLAQVCKIEALEKS